MIYNNTAEGIKMIKTSKRILTAAMRHIALILALGITLCCYTSCLSESGDNETEPPETEDINNTDATTETDTPIPPDADTDTPDDTDKTDETVTIACIGDSITEGVGVDESVRDKYSYPARLAEALGEGYEVLNYGKSGATMCGSSAGHYEAKNWFTYSGKYEEMKARSKDIDIVFIMLGTNDGNSSNTLISDLFTAEKVDTFKADYKANLTQMVNDLRAGNANVKIYLMNSPKCYRTGNTWEQTLAEVLRPMQAELAEELDLNLYDMYTFSSEVMGNRNFPDNLHPGKNGYYLIGQELAKMVADMYGTETNAGELPSTVNFEESFDTVADGTVLTQQEDTTVTIGNTKFKVRVKENSSLSVNAGVLALTRSATTTDAFIDVLMTDSVISGKYTFEISLKGSENFNSRGAIFYIFGYQFLKYKVDGSITNNAGKTIGQIATDRFMKIALTVDSETGKYEISIDGVKVDEGNFTFKETSTFRPIQFFANGSSTLYLDYVKVYSVQEG